MRLLRAQYYLRLSTAPETESDAFSLRFSSDLKALLRDWGPTTRISPVWRLVPNVENAKRHRPESSKAAVHFLCGASPDWLASNMSTEALGLLGDDSIFLTLGAHSICLISYFDDVDDEVRQLCKRHRVSYETWNVQEVVKGANFEELSGDSITLEDPNDYVGDSAPTSLSTDLLDNDRVVDDDTLGFMALELYALLSVIKSRSPPSFKVLAEDSREIARIANILISARIEDDAVLVENIEKPLLLPEAEPQDLLLTLNAALSRHSSQALSGTTPVMRTECHFWPHSLLGTGVANLALRNLAHFVTKVITQSAYHQSYEALFESPASISAPTGARHFPDTTHLRLSAQNLTSYKLHAAGNLTKHVGRRFDAPVPITYFSGRDGFTNNALTISAPLSCVSGCASYQWNLGTITHELSHRIVSGKMQVLFQRFMDDVASLKSEKSLINYFRRPPKTTGDHAARLAGFALFALHIEDFTDGKITSLRSFPAADFFRVAKERYSVLIEETLVHIFDFFHFYGGDPKLYIDFVWQSWAVQPSIVQKGDEYIKRTLVALAAKHAASENWMDIAFDDFEAVLREEPLASSLEMQAQILTVLANEEMRDRYRHHMEQMQYIINLFHVIFKSRVLRELAYDEEGRAPRNVSRRREAGVSHRISYNYPWSPGIFVSGRASDPPLAFRNPFRLLRDYSRREKPNAALSAWLLHMLAFSYSPETSDQGSSA
jgi:hypothetical protein